MSMRVLVVGDNEDQGKTWNLQLSLLLSRLKLDEIVTLIQPFTIEEALILFTANKMDLSAIVVDGYVPGNEIDTEPLVKRFRDEGFNGPIIAVSNVPWFQERLMKAGCNTECNKYLVPQKILEVVGVLSA